METLLSGASSHESISSKFDPFSPPEPVGNPKYVEIDGVRIIPAKIVFDGAFHGKVFNQSFTIINCGKYSALVRILAPSSKAFKMKHILKGQRLSAGMSISRHVSYTHDSAMALPEASFIVYINEKPLVYQIDVNLNFPHVVSSPKVLNFGDIDVRSPSEQKTIRLYNQGRKASHFSVDLRKIPLDLIVHPMKGTIDPSETVMISVEVMGTDLGNFDNEFWIKTEPPQRVRITGNMNEPKLSLVYPLTSHKLALVDFPRTYYGAEITKTLVIKNNSSIASMFCVMLDTDKGLDYLEQARHKDDDLKCFHVRPLEGRLLAQQNCPIQFKFHPKQAKSFIGRPYKDFAMVFLRIAKIHYRDGTIDDEAIKTYQAVSDLSEEDIPKSSIVSRQPFYLDDITDEDLRVCLYGELETASVTLTPNSLSITYLKAYETYIYEVNIKNMSPFLTITVRYNKIACIDVEPKQVFLEPNHSFEVTLTIKPSRIGPVDVNVVFDLIYEGDIDSGKIGDACLPVHYLATLDCPPIEPKFNLGISPKFTNEVGYLVDDVRFNSSVKMPIQAIVDKNFKRFNKDNKDLIAFPNDRPKSLRPWKSDVPCRTIFANISRYADAQDEYALSEVERNVKKYNKQLYTDYIRNTATKRQKEKLLSKVPPPHYDIGDKKLILMEGIYFSDCKIYSEMSRVMDNPYIALSPKKLLSVRISPKYVELGELAPYTSCRESFVIENKNEFDINVSIKALSNAITIKGKKRLIIKAQTTKQIFFDCWCHGVGKYHVPVYIIINDHHIFNATVSAKVIPTTVLCPIEEIVMDLKDKQTCFEIFNPVNCDITFSWEVQESSFDIFPPSGKIPPKRSLYCRVMFYPHKDALHRNEIYLISQSGAKQIINVACENRKAEIGFHTNQLQFENIPLNIPITKELILRNFSDIEIDYFISNPNPMHEISVSPIQGFLSPRCDESFEITVIFKDIVEFNCEIEFILQNEYSYVVKVQGNVVYPDIRIQPEYIQFQKTISGAYQRRVFRIRNVSKAQCCLSFDLKDFTEFFLADVDKNIICDDILLEPDEIKEVFLEFRPSEPVVYSIFLPYVINGIIGPPALNDPNSVQPSTYFKITDDPSKTAIALPESLPTVGIRCAAGAPWVEISSYELNFSCLNNENTKLWTVKNISPVAHQLAIPIIDPKYFFSMEKESGDDFEVTNKYYKASLNSGEDIVFLVTFRPEKFGSYDLELPIFLDKSVEKCPFNYLKLSGAYSEPIICSKSTLYYQTVPLHEHVNDTITLELIAHKTNCMMDVQILHEYISVKFKDKTITSKGDVEMDFAMTFCPKTECFVISEIIFRCSCDASFHVTIKAAGSDCKFAAYENFIKKKAPKNLVEFKSTFPYFPQPTDESYYADRMRYVVKTFETFLYTQRTFLKQYLKLPYGFCRIPVDIKPIGKDDSANKFDKATTPLLPLVQILTNLIQSDVATYFDDGTLTPTFDGVPGVIYIYNTYRNILTFLKSQKIFVPQLEPEYLLPYKLYILFKENVSDGYTDQQNSSQKIFSREEFESYSKQCWIDLALRMYYVFIFERIIIGKVGKPTKSTRHSKSNDFYQKEFTKYFTEHKTELEKEGIHLAESKLLLWMEFHYEKQKSVLFDLQEYPQLQNYRKFKNFETDFWDGIAIATLIVAYCPYLKDDLKKFYPTFETTEQIFHNFCLIYETLKKIKLPENLVQPRLDKVGTFDMLMIASYFYDTLPGFYPKETITFSSALGDTSSNEITLKNNDLFTIAYTPIFFSNDKKDFEVDSECIVVQAKKQKVLKITYNSRRVLTIRSVLVLSGETDGFKPAKTMALNLVGSPNIFEYSDIFTLNIDVYVDVYKHIEICSPYEKPYQAKLFMFFGDQNNRVPQDINDFIPIARQVERCVPRQFCLNPECTFDDEGFTTLSITLCYVAVGEFQYYLYFINEDVGDFCVKINVNARMKKTNFDELDVILPRYFSTTQRCACNKRNSYTCDCVTLNRSCSKLIVVDIPNKNQQLFEALRLMFKISTEESEFRFWNKLLAYAKGFHILRNRLKNAFLQFYLPYTSVLNPTVKYKVEFSKAGVSYPQYVTFNNVTSSGVVQIPFHWNSSEDPRQETVTLYADHTQEIRRFKLNFQPHVDM